VKGGNGPAGAAREQPPMHRGSTRPPMLTGPHRWESTLSWPPPATGTSHRTGHRHASTLRAGASVALAIAVRAASLLSAARAMPFLKNYFKQKGAFEAESASQHMNSQPVSRARAVKDSWAPPCPWCLND